MPAWHEVAHTSEACAPVATPQPHVRTKSPVAENWDIRWPPVAKLQQSASEMYTLPDAWLTANPDGKANSPASVPRSPKDATTPFPALASGTPNVRAPTASDSAKTSHRPAAETSQPRAIECPLPVRRHGPGARACAPVLPPSVPPRLVMIHTTVSQRDVWRTRGRCRQNIA